MSGVYIFHSVLAIGFEEHSIATKIRIIVVASEDTVRRGSKIRMHLSNLIDQGYGLNRMEMRKRDLSSRCSRQPTKVSDLSIVIQTPTMRTSKALMRDHKPLEDHNILKHGSLRYIVLLHAAPKSKFSRLRCRLCQRCTSYTSLRLRNRLYTDRRVTCMGDTF